ncbi:hypothetical protein BUE76_12480 [Cnuella takakiae]|nr:hypothetical protein BUE76_12480 [Cnuella takakiae]
MFAGILLFSLCGYRVVIDLLQSRADQTMVTAINEEAYQQEQLISLKVPVSLPYYTNSEQFQHISGAVTIEGTVYQYVKRRIYNDSIEYLCLRDVASTRLQGARDQFFQLAYDLQTLKAGKAKQQTPVKPLMLEYCPGPVWETICFTNKLAMHVGYANSAISPEPFRAQPSQPPEQVSKSLYC